MLAILKYPHENTSGNLLWHSPYLYPQDHLQQGIDELIEKGYWVSAFPEGDGLAFSHKIIGNKGILVDLKIAFPWMKIKEQLDHVDLELDEDAQKTQLVVLPVSRLRIAEAVLTEDFCIFPAGEFVLDHSIIKKIDGSEFQNISASSNLRDHINEITGINIEVFEQYPLIVFYSRKVDYKGFRKLQQSDDEFLIKELSAETEPIMDIVRFFNADYSIPEFLPSKPGIWNSRYSAVLIYFVPYKLAHILSREVEYKDYIKGIGMDVTNSENINYNPLVLNHAGETGNILKHALRLHSSIMETEEQTLKFTQIITLFEYLASPLKYIPGKNAKTNIAVHVAKTKTEYHKFCNRYEELTAGLKEDDNRIPGIRTSIVHLGKRLEDLIPDKDMRNK
ncbi:MAG: hypothetical protein EOO44_20045, partial [Flavobacterium sp.]